MRGTIAEVAHRGPRDVQLGIAAYWLEGKTVSRVPESKRQASGCRGVDNNQVQPV